MGQDHDADGVPDHLDSDDDNDGIDTQAELADASVFSVDVDGDGVPNYLDSDADGDGVLDAEEGREDTDGDGTPNYLDASGSNLDLKGRGCAQSKGSLGCLALLGLGLFVRRQKGLPQKCRSRIS